MAAHQPIILAYVKVRLGPHQPPPPVCQSEGWGKGPLFAPLIWPAAYDDELMLFEQQSYPAMGVQLLSFKLGRCRLVSSLHAAVSACQRRLVKGRLQLGNTAVRPSECASLVRRFPLSISSCHVTVRWCLLTQLPLLPYQ